MINILMFVPNRVDATSFYRAMGPFSEIRRNTDNVNLIFADRIDWSVINMVDMVFIQRPCDQSHLQVLQLAKQWDIPTWIDFDDLLFDVPEDNPAYEHYMNPKTREMIVKIVKEATVVTVSTQQIKDCLQLKQNPLNERVYVVPNALMDRVVYKKQPFKHKQHINWRGSNTHQKDIAEYGGPIMEIAHERPGVTFSFVGYNPWFVTQNMRKEQALVVPAMTISEYIDFMEKSNPSIQIVPLDRSMFNLCKSNIAWIEATLAGAVTIAPDWAEWQRPGIITYRDEKDFKEAMQFALDNPEEMAKYHEMSWDYIQENLFLSKVNEKRMEIIESLYRVCIGDEPKWPEGGERIPEPTHLMELQ